MPSWQVTGSVATCGESYGAYAQGDEQAALVENEHDVLSAEEAIANEEAFDQSVLGELGRRRGLGSRERQPRAEARNLRRPAGSEVEARAAGAATDGAGAVEKTR